MRRKKERLWLGYLVGTTSCWEVWLRSSGLFPPRPARGGPSTSALEREQAACPACTLLWKRCRLAPPTPSGPGLALLGPRSSASASLERVRLPSGSVHLPWLLSG